MRRARRSVLIIGFMALIVPGSPAGALEPKLSATSSACMEASNSVTANMRECLARETGRWDTRLNRAYNAVLHETRDRPASKKRLREAQRAWLKYRQANCAYYGRRSGGSIDIINGASCWLDDTAHRALELENMLETERPK